MNIYIIQLVYYDAIACKGVELQKSGALLLEVFTNEDMTKRQQWEIANGGFGKGKLVDMDEKQEVTQKKTKRNGEGASTKAVQTIEVKTLYNY